MSEELFDIQPQKSPRLLWMEKYGIQTKLVNPQAGPDDEDEFGKQMFRWYAGNTGANTEVDWKNDRVFGGDTEDAALAAWAKANRRPMWFEESFARTQQNKNR